MNEQYRVVLTCWDYGKPFEPYADNVSTFFNSHSEAKMAVSKCVRDELKILNKGRTPVAVKDSDGNVVCYDYDFRADKNGENDTAIRFWDGDDYWDVTHYDVYPILFHSLSQNLRHECAYDYRGFTIYVNHNRNRFEIARNDVTLAIKDSLDAALKYLDEYSLTLKLSIFNRCAPATYVSIWDNGVKLIFPCKVNMDTREVFDIELDPDVLDEFEVFQGEMIYFQDGKECPLYDSSHMNHDKTCFWRSDNNFLVVSANEGKDKTSLADRILSASVRGVKSASTDIISSKEPTPRAFINLSSKGRE